MVLLVMFILVVLFLVSTKILNYAEKRLNAVLFNILLVSISVILFIVSFSVFVYMIKTANRIFFGNSQYVEIALVENYEIKFVNTLDSHIVTRLRQPKKNQVYLIALENRIIAVNGKPLKHKMLVSDWKKAYKFYVNKIPFNKQNLYKYVQFNNKLAQQAYKSIKQQYNNNDEDYGPDAGDFLYSPLSPVSVWWW